MTTEQTFSLTMSPAIGKLAAALAKAQLAMRPAVKDRTNPHFKNTYATLASCIDAVRVLHEHGIAVVQPPVPHGVDGVCVATILLHESGEWLRGDLYMPASKKDAQGFGSALSYARRYGLCATANLATDDDDGEAARRSTPETNGKPAPVKAESDPVEVELTGLYSSASTADHIATADATAARYSQAKKLTGAARERLLKLRAVAVGRVSAPQGAAS